MPASQMTTNQYLSTEIQDLLDGLTLKNQVEILANVITFFGVTHMGTPVKITPRNIAEVVLKDRQSNGETIANALALQGLTMLLWLEEAKPQ